MAAARRMLSIASHARRRYDVVICGGAAFGSSAAFFLREEATRLNKALSVLVVEKDPSYQQCATALSAASYRTQFSTPENVAIGLFAADFFHHAPTRLQIPGEPPADIRLCEDRGYLFLATDDAQAEQLERNHKIQTAQGAKVRLLSADGVKKRYPWMNCDDIVLASLGEQHEGWLDSYQFLQALRNKARFLGAEYMRGSVSRLLVAEDGQSLTGVQLADGSVVEAGCVVNACGTGGAELASTANVHLPVVRRKRSIFSVLSPAPLPDCPMIIGADGVYCRPDSLTQPQFICGVAPPSDADPDVAADDFAVQESLFDSTIWPSLAHRVPAFEALRVKASWAGHYAFNTVDHNLIFGPHSRLRNLYLANGCSGHGLMQSPAVGRALSELIIHGRFLTLHLDQFTCSRLNCPETAAKNAETNVI
eukprot:m.100541 g.100541  ORF g.100541 m.100541 type:complete len:422 (-) comp15629_c0_seq1:651-1916(-)